MSAAMKDDRIEDNTEAIHDVLEGSEQTSDLQYGVYDGLRG